MVFENTLAWIRNSIARYPSQFAAGKARQPALARFKTGSEVATFLAQLSTDHEERYRVLRALIAEFKASKDAVWSAILVTAFAPLLLSTRRAMGETRNATRDQVVLLAFLKALGAAHVNEYPVLAIQGGLLRFLKREREISKRHRRDVPTAEIPEERSYTIDKEIELRAAIHLLPKVVDGNDEMIDVVLDTFFGGEPIAAYVARVHPELDPLARNALVERLRRERAAVIHRLRVRLNSEGGRT